MIRLYEAIDTTNYLFLVMELGDAGDLWVNVKKNIWFKNLIIVIIFLGTII